MVQDLITADLLDSTYATPWTPRTSTAQQARIPVFLVGQRNLALEGLRTLLLKHDIQVDDSATSVRELSLSPSLHTQRFLVIFEVMTDLDERRDEINAFRRLFPNACIIVLLGRFQTSIASLSSEIRVNAIVDRNIACEALMKTLRVALAGYAVLSPVTGKDPVEPSFTGMRNTTKPSGLSDREAEIIGCIAEGQSNKVIARRFSISEATVKIHVRGILRKVDARNRTQAAVWALQKGFGNHVEAVLD